jgi:hypothetical protein
MKRRLGHCGGRPLLHEPTGIEHGDTVGDLRRHAEIMSDQQHRQPGAMAQGVEQREELRLDRGVERGGRLVGEQQPRLGGDRHGDGGALAQAARELMRERRRAIRGIGYADLAQQLDRAAAGGAAVEPLVRHQHLVDLLADGQHGIEARHRILEHRADGDAAQLAEPGTGRRQSLLPGEPNAAGDDGVGRQQPDQR